MLYFSFLLLILISYSPSSSREKKEALNTAVSREDFLLALSKVNRSVSDHDLVRFTEWMAEFGSA